MSASPAADSCLANARDIATAAPGLRAGVLYRSDAPAPGDQAPDGLEPWPPRTVIDMRGVAEKGHDHPLATHARVVNIPVLDDAALTGAQARETLTSLSALYTHITEGPAAAALVRAVAEVATADAPVLIHCSAGKDRTGVLAAVIEALVGVSRERIVGDYVATAAQMHGVMARMMRGVSDEFREAALSQMPAEVFDAPAHAIEAVLDRWDAEGGVAAWYRAHGGDEDTVAALRGRLLAD
ncbi:tyrosine-protein phosphatase [Demequina sp. NBRC 110055]|uniref:tyrosine-protein phosphatase n=1 Tax=Demequina sp. NBRC 110055 TaxID=1570344 RepID=UPI0013566D07|nr:tyrosine-protein phosphatase [Demequina sp. NBRC 110055]